MLFSASVGGAQEMVDLIFSKSEYWENNFQFWNSSESLNILQLLFPELLEVFPASNFISMQQQLCGKSERSCNKSALLIKDGRVGDSRCFQCWHPVPLRPSHVGGRRTQKAIWL